MSNQNLSTDEVIVVPITANSIPIPAVLPWLLSPFPWEYRRYCPNYCGITTVPFACHSLSANVTPYAVLLPSQRLALRPPWSPTTSTCILPTNTVLHKSSYVVINSGRVPAVKVLLFGGQSGRRLFRWLRWSKLWVPGSTRQYIVLILQPRTNITFTGFIHLPTVALRSEALGILGYRKILFLS